MNKMSERVVVIVDKNERDYSFGEWNGGGYKGVAVIAQRQKLTGITRWLGKYAEPYPPVHNSGRTVQRASGGSHS